MVRGKAATACREEPRKTKNRPSRELYQTVHTIQARGQLPRGHIHSDGHDTKSGTVKKERWRPKNADVKSVRIPLWNEIWATKLRLAKSSNKVVIKKIKQILFRFSVLREQGEVSIAREPFLDMTYMWGCVSHQRDQCSLNPLRYR